MNLYNIKDKSEQVSFAQAVRQGLGREQGLFFPEVIAPLAEVDALAKRLWVESLQLEAVLETLADLGWVGRLEEGGYALLVDPAEVKLEPLVQALLLGPGHATAFVWRDGLLPGMRLQDALGAAPGPVTR